MVLKILLTLLISSSYASIEYGENRRPLFYGAIYPFGEFDAYLNQFIFDDEKRRSNFVINNTQSDLLDIEAFLVDYNQQNQCSDQSFVEFSNYIRYINRILVLSHLDFTLKEYNKSAIQIGWQKTCQYSIGSLLKTCRPKSNYMKFFVKSSEIIGKKRSSYLLKYNESSHENLTNWLGSFSTDFESDLTKLNISHACKGCSAPKVNDLKSICKREKDLFSNICSEDDRLFGNYGIHEVYRALLYSDAIRELSNKVYNYKGCLQRYSNYYESRQKIPKGLKLILSSSYYFLNKSHNLQGELFDVASLKSFLDLGLTSLFDISETKVTSKKSPKQNLNKSIPKLKEEVAKKIEKIIVKIKRKKKKIATVKVIKQHQSHFSLLNETFNLLKLESIDINMDKFKSDYIFTPRVIAILTKTLKNFIKRKGLEEMKQYDSLGSKKSPIPLLFIKFLIDNSEHEGLFNMTAVIGNRFYIKNDIDIKGQGLDKLSYITLWYSDLERKWQIKIIQKY